MTHFSQWVDVSQSPVCCVLHQLWTAWTFPGAPELVLACCELSVITLWTRAAKSQQTGGSWQISRAWCCRVHGEHPTEQVDARSRSLPGRQQVHAPGGVNWHSVDSSGRNMEPRGSDWKTGEWETLAVTRRVSLTAVAHAEVQEVRWFSDGHLCCSVGLLHEVWNISRIGPRGSGAESAACPVSDAEGCQDNG